MVGKLGGRGECDNLGACGETLTLTGGQKELTLQPPEGGRERERGRKMGECADWRKKGEGSNFWHAQRCCHTAIIDWTAGTALWVTSTVHHIPPPTHHAHFSSHPLFPNRSLLPPVLLLTPPPPSPLGHTLDFLTLPIPPLHTRAGSFPALKLHMYTPRVHK